MGLAAWEVVTVKSSDRGQELRADVNYQAIKRRCASAEGARASAFIPLENSFLVVQGSIAYQNDRMNLTDQEPLRYPDYLLRERRYMQKCEKGFHKQFWGKLIKTKLTKECSEPKRNTSCYGVHLFSKSSTQFGSHDLSWINPCAL